MLSLQQWFGLIIAGIAMWVYNLKDELDENGLAVKGVHVADAGELHVSRSISLCVRASMARRAFPRRISNRAASSKVWSKVPPVP